MFKYIYSPPPQSGVPLLCFNIDFKKTFSNKPYFLQIKKIINKKLNGGSTPAFGFFLFSNTNVEKVKK